MSKLRYESERAQTQKDLETKFDKSWESAVVKPVSFTTTYFLTVPADKAGLSWQTLESLKLEKKFTFVNEQTEDPRGCCCSDKNKLTYLLI